jgi:arylsulfatase A-like enzyme
VETAAHGGRLCAFIDQEESLERPTKPNFLVIWGDDIGITNLSCYSDRLLGYRTPNIERIANEGMRFTDSYGEQSCTAGRFSFITGQSVYRTGLRRWAFPAPRWDYSRRTQR